MGYPRLASDLLNGDHVYAPVIDKILLGVVLRAGLHMRLLAMADRDLGRTKAPGCSGLDLDKDSERILANHQIDLAVWRSKIPIQQLVTAGGEVVRCRLFPPSPNALISTHLPVA